jgi:hypothetical protein
MSKKRIPTALAVLLGIGVSCAAAAAQKFDACSLLTRREIQAVQRDRVTATKASEPQRNQFAVSQCFYTLATFSKSISLEVTRRRPGETEGPRSHWKQMFTRAMRKGEEKEETEESGREAGRERDRESASPRRISGVGDEAFWDGSSIGGGLYVLRDETYMRLSVGGPDPAEVKIEKLKKLARSALRRLS